jgi:hypothetical protein
MTALFEKLRQAEIEAEAQAQQEYKLLVQRLADGTDDPLERVQEILHDAGKTASDLEQAVALRQRRQAWRQQIADAQAATEQRPIVQEKIDKANAVLEAAKQKHAENLWPLQQQIDRANNLTAQAADAQQQLLQTCDDAALLAKRDHNHSAARLLGRQIKAMQSRFNDQQSMARTANDPNDAAGYKQGADRIAEELATMREKQAALQTEASEITKAILEA